MILIFLRFINFFRDLSKRHFGGTFSNKICCKKDVIKEKKYDLEKLRKFCRKNVKSNFKFMQLWRYQTETKATYS